jgi:hypothetical protein
MNVNLLEAVLIRPKMYTLGGTFEEVVAFLEGYYSGMSKGNLYAIPVLEWASFRTWLSEKVASNTSEVFARFRDLHADGPAALEGMRNCLSDFREEMKKRQETLLPADLRGGGPEQKS